MINQIVTRGMSTTQSNLLVTRGFSIAGVIREVVEVSRRFVRYGGSAAKKAVERVEEIIVFAKLKSVNSTAPVEPVQGSIRISFDRFRRLSVQAIKTGIAVVKSRVDEIVITIKRIR